MGIERAAVLYPRNSTTVDSGTGIDIRLLSATNGGTTENTTFVTATHTQDNVERTFDPASSNNNVADSFSLQKLGWALRLTEDMTPADDTNCNAYLSAAPGGFNVILSAGLGWTGGTPTSNSFPTWKASLWRYNPATDTGTFIASGSDNTQQWSALQNNTFKTVTIPITLAAGVEFAQGEILLLQLGLNTGTLSNPVSGTITYTMAVATDNNTTRISFAAASTQHLYQVCSLSAALVGDGALSSGGMAAVMADDMVGAGVVTELLAAAMSDDMIGDGVLSRGLTAAMSDDMVGDGILDRTLAAVMSDDMVGDGTLTSPLLVTVDRSMVGNGVLSTTRSAEVSVISDLVGEGVLTETHPVTAARTFDLVGVGTVLTDVCFPVTSIPTGACPSDWSPNDGLKSIAGDVFFHEPPNESDPVVGATVTLIRDSDGLRITSTLTDASGHYSFGRDTNDPNTYHVEVRYADQQGLSEGGCVPV